MLAMFCMCIIIVIIDAGSMAPMDPDTRRWPPILADDELRCRPPPMLPALERQSPVEPGVQLLPRAERLLMWESGVIMLPPWAPPGDVMDGVRDSVERCGDDEDDAIPDCVRRWSAASAASQHGLRVSKGG